MRLLVPIIALTFAGCSSPPTEPPVVSVESRQKLAEVAYTTDLLACVEAYPSGDPRVDRCADGVRANWHRQDGGK